MNESFLPLVTCETLSDVQQYLLEFGWNKTAAEGIDTWSTPSGETLSIAPDGECVLRNPLHPDDPPLATCKFRTPDSPEHRSVSLGHPSRQDRPYPLQWLIVQINLNAPKIGFRQGILQHSKASRANRSIRRWLGTSRTKSMRGALLFGDYGKRLESISLPRS